MKSLNKLKKKTRMFLNCTAKYEDLQGFSYTVKELVHMYQENTKLSAQFGTFLSDSILSHKTSDTIFLLGSGPSINHLGKEEFAIIHQHDSIGFNFWFAHEFVPSIYMIQLPPKNPNPMLNLFYDRSEAYQGIPFILRGSALAQGMIDFDDSRLQPLRNMELYLLNEYPIHSKCSIDIDLLIEYVYILGLMQHGHVSKLVPKWRGTLGLLVSLAYQMGYKNIVCCGMDMKDNRHFWDDPEYASLKKIYKLPEVSNIHAMADSSYSSNTVPQYIYKLRDWMKTQSDVHLYVAHSDTVLYPKIPLYHFLLPNLSDSPA